MKKVWVDFNDIDHQGLTTSLQKFASERIERGDLVYASDSEGTSCWGAVIHTFEEQIWIILDLETLGS
jgi:hypothetical protein